MGGSHVTLAQNALQKIETLILFPLMFLMYSVAFLVFLYGVYEYVLNADDKGAREKGRSHMMYGIIGLLVMACAHAILKIAAGTFGISA